MAPALTDVGRSFLPVRIWLRILRVFCASAKLVPINVDKDEIHNFLADKGAVTGDVISPAMSLKE